VTGPPLPKIGESVVPHFFLAARDNEPDLRCPLLPMPMLRPSKKFEQLKMNRAFEDLVSEENDSA
jgi:hypothetical protein